MKPFLCLFVSALVALSFGCAKKAGPAKSDSAIPAKHEHTPPHGGTAVVLGEETYHLELVRDAETGKLTAYVFDGELENFMRSSSLVVEIAVAGKSPDKLVFHPVANPATGETVGDSAMFEAQADWLKTADNFDGVLKTITIRGTPFSEVKFNFPKGNDKD
jgi:hypothetical protein